jgi:hypothetical protein
MIKILECRRSIKETAENVELDIVGKKNGK